jgi:hypothetical protein
MSVLRFRRRVDAAAVLAEAERLTAPAIDLPRRFG